MLVAGLVRRLAGLLGLYRIYERVLEEEVRGGAMPNHVAVILDGNRRWARSRGLGLWEGYETGARKVEEFLDWCYELGIRVVTLFALSTENLGRREEELESVFRVLRSELERALERGVFRRRRVRFKAIGRIEALPEDIKALVKRLERETAEYNERFLNLALVYGGRWEIVNAVRRIAERVASGELRPEDISERTFVRFLETAHLPYPDPDLIIRTSGEERLSNFLLWQAAYSELVFLDVYWPDIRRIDFLRAIRTFQKRHRRYGK